MGHPTLVNNPKSTGMTNTTSTTKNNCSSEVVQEKVSINCDYSQKHDVKAKAVWQPTMKLRRHTAIQTVTGRTRSNVGLVLLWLPSAPSNEMNI